MNANNISLGYEMFLLARVQVQCENAVKRIDNNELVCYCVECQAERAATDVLRKAGNLRLKVKSSFHVAPSNLQQSLPNFPKTVT